MATDGDRRTEQKRRLTMLMRAASAETPEQTQKTLKRLITDTIIEMEAEDVAYVQKKLEEEAEA